MQQCANPLDFMSQLLRTIHLLARPSKVFFAKSQRARPMSASPSLASAPKAAETDIQAEATANATGVTPDSIAKRLSDQISAQHVEIEDMSGTAHIGLHLSSLKGEEH